MTPLLSNMSPDDMRVAMAKLEGYQFPTSGRVGVFLPNGWWVSACALPNYLADLNAVARVEARLTDSQREHVIDILMGYANRPYWKQVADAAFATAPQRVDAILLATRKATLDSSPPSP